MSYTSPSRNSPTGPFEVGLLSYQIIGWVGIVFFGGAAIAAYVSDQPWLAVGFLPFVAVSLGVALGAGRFTLDSHGVAHRSVFGRFHISWHEITQVEIGIRYGTYVFHGTNKHFVLSPPGAWSGPQKSAAYELLRRKIEESRITPYPSNAAEYKMHRNVRVSRQGG